MSNSAQRIMVCPVCGDQHWSAVQELFDDRYGYPGLFEIAACAGCGHQMTLPLLQEQELGALYGQYYPRKSLSSHQVRAQAASAASRWSGLVRWWMGTDNQGQYCARPGEKMLDVGCGSGLSMLEAQQAGAEVWGIEADPNVQRLAGELGLRIHQGSLHDKPFPDVTFDLIVLNQVIEHIPAPDLALAMIRERLTKNGRAILIFPNTRSVWCRLSGARWVNWHIPYHLHHFNAASFARLAQRCGFQVVRARTVTPNMWTLLQLRASFQHPVPGQANPLWAVAPAGDAGPAAKTGISWKRVVLLLVLSGVAVVNRLLDGLGQGDSLMVELQRDDAP